MANKPHQEAVTFTEWMQTAALMSQFFTSPEDMTHLQAPSIQQLIKKEEDSDKYYGQKNAKRLAWEDFCKNQPDTGSPIKIPPKIIFSYFAATPQKRRPYSSVLQRPEEKETARGGAQRARKVGQLAGEGQPKANRNTISFVFVKHA